MIVQHLEERIEIVRVLIDMADDYSSLAAYAHTQASDGCSHRGK
jgi:hypothetical protein